MLWRINMIKLVYVVTIEYRDGNVTKLTLDTYQRVREWLDPRLDSTHSAREVLRVTICPTWVP
jgi:hypothetical protein